MNAITVPAIEIHQEWLAEVEIRLTLTEAEVVARRHHQRLARCKVISNAIGRHFPVDELDVVPMTAHQQANQKRRGGY